MFGLACCVAAVPAGAQELQDRQRGTVQNPNEVLARPRPGYDATGIKAGAFNILPYVDIQTIYDDNVYASDTFKRSDVSGIATVGGSAQSTWSRHSLSLDGYAAAERFSKETRQNNERGEARLRGRLDLRRTLSLDATARIARLVEARGSQGDLFIAGSAPTFTVKEAAAGVQYAPGRITLRAEGGVSDFSYSSIRVNGTDFSQRYRNNRQVNVGGRASYMFSPDLSVFASGSRSDVSYDNRSSSFDLDSKNTSALAGVDFRITRLLVGEIGVGVVRQSFADPRFKDVSGLAYDGRVVFNATTLLSFTLSGRSTIKQSAIIGVAGVLRRDVSLGADYEFMRNVIVHGDASLIDRDYRGVDRSDSLVGVRLGARYLINRSLNVGLNYQHEGQRSNGPGARDFDANRLSLVLRLQR